MSDTTRSTANMPAVPLNPDSEAILGALARAEQSGDLRARRPQLLTSLFRRDTLVRAVNIVALTALDLVLLFVSIVIALVLKTALLGQGARLDFAVDYAKDVAPFAALVMLLLFARDGLYRPRRERPGSAQVLGALFKVTVLTLVFAEINGEQFSSYYIFYSTLTIASLLIVSARWLYDRAAEFLERSLTHRKTAVIVGTNDQIEAVAHALTDEPHPRVKPIGFVSLEPRKENGLRNLGTINDLEAHLGEVDEVIIADPNFPAERAFELVDRCHRAGVVVRIAPTTMEILLERGEFVPGESVPLFELKAPVFEGIDFVVKRTFDLVVSGTALVLLAPLFAVIAAAVKITSSGPVFFPSPRPGIGGETFACLKFRTMRSDADAMQEELEQHNEADGALFKIKDDPRITSIGGILRRLSLDELPQLINVLRGDMSLVGPRPLPIRDFDRLEDWHKKRYLVLPGVTGLWQVSGRSDLDFDELVRLDFLYIETWSVFQDIVIMFKTLPAVFARKGAF